VQDFLEGKGVVEMEPNIILDQINNMNYVNVLKMVQMMPPQQQMYQQPGMQQPGMQQPGMQ
jgi:hypothetical protein